MPLTGGLPAPGTRIAAELTPEASRALAGEIGSGATGVEGLLIRADSAAWELSLLRVDHAGGAETMWNRETVRFPAGSLARVRERQPDTRRSVLAGAIVVLGALGLAELFGGGIFSDSDGGTPNPPPQ